MNMKKQNDIIDIDLTPTRKKRFRVDGDNDRILELNVSDMGILDRFNDVYPKLIELAEQGGAAFDFDDEASTEEQIEHLGNAIKDVDTKMRKLMDKLFNANVSEVCAPDGTMWDMFDGEFRFEHIIEALTPLYGSNISTEMDKVSKRIAKHTKKYTK